MSTLTVFDGPRHLSLQDWELLTAPRRIELSLNLRVGDRWEPAVVRLDVDAMPLAVLVEAAALGHRVYEFMNLLRPGDLLRYWMLRVVDAPQELLDRLGRRLPLLQRIRFKPSGLGQSIPFVVFDATFWEQASRWHDEDADNLDRAWIDSRRARPWPPELDAMFSAVRGAQERLRSCAKGLLAHEIGLMDRREHARDCWASTAEIDYEASVPAWQSTTDSGLSEIIVSLAKRDDVKSLSCGIDDRMLWRELVWVQVQRALRTRALPQSELFLAGPEGGIRHAEPEDWGGGIHIPYEGACEADVFVKPGWHAFDEQRARANGTVAAGLFDKAKRYALVKGYYGEFPRDECVRCGGWSLYRLLVR